MLVDMLITIMLYSQKPSIEQPLPVDKRIERYVSRSYDRTIANCALRIAYKESRFNQFALERSEEGGPLTAPVQQQIGTRPVLGCL